jgi:FkbM family methyltransferase
MKAILARLLGWSINRTIPQRILQTIELFSALGQGRGWGAGTISEEISACRSLLLESPRLLIDIGGNTGSYSEEFLKRFPDAEVHIFEASSHNVKLLTGLFSLAPGVRVVGSALSDYSGVSVLYSDEPGSGLSSLSRRRLDHFRIEMSEAEEVTVVRFDEYWKSFSSSHPVIDYVKIDVEGHELSVLKGFGEFLKKVKLVQFEFGGCNIDTRTFFQDFWYFFTAKNFSLHRVTPRGAVAIKAYRETDEFFVTTNYIAVNNDYAK